jgi:ABC-type bacteriocin/lantibiotic exporter with double-glycine peptidase domain
VTHTPFLNVIPQRAQMDCAVACLAMLTGVTYEAALLAFGSECASGVETRAIKAAAKKLGRKLTWSRRFDLENDTGLLAVRSDKWQGDHVVVLKEGLIVDTDATVWETDVFLAAYDATAMSLLTLD